MGGLNADRLKEIHDNYHPNVIVATQTSGTSAGWIIKEAYKKAYPNEPVPKILTINVKNIRHGKGTKKREDEFRKVVNVMKNKLNAIRLNGDIVVIDEASGLTEYGRKDLGRKTGMFTSELHEKKYDPSNSRNSRTFYIAAQAVRTAVKEAGYNARVGTCQLEPAYFFQHRYSDTSPPRIHHAWYETRNKKGKYVVRHQHKPEVKEVLRGIIAEMRKEGREIGEEIRAEREAKQKGLEDTFGIISIAGFLFSLLFLSGITGNVIGNITNSTSTYIGVVLFLIGIVGTFFYFRKRN